jgi:hypothetical protein
MNARVVLTPLAIFSVGMAGGVVGARMAPVNAPLGSSPAVAAEVRVQPPSGNPDGIADLVDQVKVAVVNIDTVAHRRAPSQQEAFRYFFDGQAPQQNEEEKGIGSGFVIDPSGLIVTNFKASPGSSPP